MSYHGFQKLWRRVNLVAMLMLRPKKQKKSDSGPPAAHLGSFRGRKKINQSTEDETPVGADFSSLEYAIERTILEAPVLELSYYADVVGFVPTDTVHNPPFTGDPFDIGNGDMPPEWGIDLVVRNGLLRYGPWADRQRAELQRAFFPSAYRDVRRTARLKPGDQRVWPSMKIFIELRDSTTLQIPFREASKASLFTRSAVQLLTFLCRIGNGMALSNIRDLENGKRRPCIYEQEKTRRSATSCL